MSKTLSPYQKAKKHAIHGRCTVNDLRIEIKKEFKDRLRSLRIKQRDFRRNIYENDDISTILKANLLEIQESILADQEAMTSMDENTFFKLFIDIEEEILNEDLELLGQLHERDVNQEVNSILDNLLNVCHICDKFTYLSTNICQDCAKECFNEY